MTAKRILPLLLALLLPIAAHAACVLDKAATVPLRVIGGTITVPLVVNAIAGTFILDTGAARSLVTETAARRLGLTRDQWVGTTMTGVGGIERRPNALPRSLTLGGVALVRRTINHDTSLTVGVMPSTHIGPLVIDGLLGRDFLSLFDLDLDLPDRRLTLYRVNGCAGRFPPWQRNYDTIPVNRGFGEAIVLPVTLDGRALGALLDTGASSGLLTARGMYRLGLHQAAIMADPANQISGVGPHRVTVRLHRFRALRVGNQTTDAPTLWVEPVHLRPFVDMVLGADWLARRRIWISFATRQLFVAPQ